MSPALSDEEVERAWRAGARSAFNELFRRHYAGAVAYAARFTGDPAAAEDVVQQAFLNVLQRRAGAGRFKALVYTATRNLALNELRRRGRRYVAQQGLPEALPAGGPGHEAPVARLVREEEAAALREALAALPDDEREAFCLKETRGLTYPEIGTLMGLHPDAVRRRVARAFERLRALLTREEGRT